MDPILIKQREDEGIKDFYYRFSVAWELMFLGHEFTRTHRTNLFAQSLTDQVLYRRFVEHSSSQCYLQDWDETTQGPLQAYSAPIDKKDYQQLLEFYFLTVKEWNPHRNNGTLLDTTFNLTLGRVRKAPPQQIYTETWNLGARKKEPKPQCWKIWPKDELPEEKEKGEPAAEICYRYVTDRHGIGRFEEIGLIFYQNV